MPPELPELPPGVVGFEPTDPIKMVLMLGTGSLKRMVS
jgi:hypothetical protein